jgi:hypothetical protein
MNNIGQSYSEEEANQLKPKTEDQFQSFTVTSAKPGPMYGFIIAFIILIAIITTLGIIYPDLRIGGVIAMPILLIIFMVSFYPWTSYFKEQKILELYTDRLIIRDKDILTINLDHISAYGVRYDKGSVWLIIKLDTGKKIKVTSIYGKGLTEFNNVFVAKMDELIRDKHYPIKYLTDWSSLVIAVLFTIMLLSIILKYFQLI